MKGAIIGDVIGSRFEGHRRDVISKEFRLFTEDSQFTDDTVLTVAVAEHLLTGEPLAPLLKQYFHRYRGRGYGGKFRDWARGPSLEPFNSFGNGSAMRVSPVAWWFDTEAEVMAVATATAAVTHNHPEGIKGAVAIALATFLARKGASKEAIKERIVVETQYSLDLTLEASMAVYDRGASCQQSVPVALIAFFEGQDFEDVIRGAIAVGGDSDTIACMAGAVAEAFFGLPKPLWKEAQKRLEPQLIDIINRYDMALAARKTGQ